jgi:hypothetical protein
MDPSVMRLDENGERGAFYASESPGADHAVTESVRRSLGKPGTSPKALGGGSSAVAASSHAGCARFRGTDPLITGRTRRALARDVGFRDEFGGIPEARWMRAMTFERLVRDKRFASELATTAVGRLDLARPTKVVIVNARLNVERTAELLAEAHGRAVDEGAATMLHGLAIPFVGFEGDGATDVKPDFAVVAPQRPENEDDEVRASWLILGDAKDYERVRSRIDDARLLKGFLQVALGAESASRWSRLPGDMNVHRYGVLAVPRNAFLQPEALVELLDDHRDEVRMRVDQRRRETAATVFDEDTTAIVENQGHPHPCASAPGERLRGAVHPHRPNGMPRLAPDHRPPPPRTRPTDLHPALQPRAPTPRTRTPSASTPSACATAGGRCSASRSPRRPRP